MYHEMFNTWLKCLDDERGKAWIDYLADERSKGRTNQVDNVLSFWKEIVSHVTDMPVPAAEYIANSETPHFYICWNYEKCILEIDLYDNKTLDWFYYDKDSKEAVGTEDPIPMLPFLDEFIFCVQQTRLNS